MPMTIEGTAISTETGAGQASADVAATPTASQASPPPTWPCRRCGRYENEKCPQWNAAACPHGRGSRPAELGPLIPRTVKDPWGAASASRSKG